MFCNQCEQAAGCVGCSGTQGICGKNEDVQSLQEMMLYGLKGMAAYAHHARRLGMVDEAVDAFVEMLPAHMYPRLREHPNMGGHYGGAWQKQRQEFPAFSGPIVATTNCILTLTLCISWFEQKAVAVLLTLLALGVKGITLGPNPPAFVSNNVFQILQDKFDLKLIGQSAVEDLAAVV
jgi:hydroxylamine reductase (hybrid-cluster protein)